MWWRNDGATSGIGAPKNAIYGTIYDTVNGGTLTQQKLYERIVTESQYEVCTPFNPLDLLTRAAKVSFRDAVAAIDSHCVEDMVTEGEVALGFAAKHPHVGTVQRLDCAEPLTVDEIAVLHVYTMQTSFYTRLNQEPGGYGQGHTHGAVDDFLLITKLLVSALRKLPPMAVKLFRGVKMNYKAILGGDVKVKDVKQWNQVTSCSTRPDVLQDKTFLGIGTAGIDCVSNHCSCWRQYQAIQRIESGG